MDFADVGHLLRALIVSGAFRANRSILLQHACVGKVHLPENYGCCESDQFYWLTISQ